MPVPCPEVTAARADDVPEVWDETGGVAAARRPRRPCGLRSPGGGRGGGGADDVPEVWDETGAVDAAGALRLTSTFRQRRRPAAHHFGIGRGGSSVREPSPSKRRK